MYVKKSLPRDTSRVNPGAVTAKQQEITLIDTEDILEMPERDSKGVLLVGNIVLKPDARMIKLYLTPSMQEPTYASDGDEDAESFTHSVKGFHPGNSLDAKEFLQNWLGRPVMAMWSGCNNATGLEVYGTPCAPLKLKGEFTANNEKTGFDFTFASVQKTSYVPATYAGELTLGANYEAAAFAVDFLEANAPIQQLPVSNAANTIDINSIDFVHGDIVSLIGGGGTTPATLSNGAATAATVLLKDGTDWTAVDEAVISFQVFEDGAAVYLLEVART